MTRDRLIRAIEAGISAAQSDLTPNQAEALRKVGRTASRVRVGGFGCYANYGCPATQAGLYRQGEGITAPVMRFAGGFDDASGINFSPGGTVVEVEG